MNLYDLTFWFLAALTVGSAFSVVMHKNIVYSAFSLMFTLLGISGLYVLLAADFVAVVQLVVYVGGILILLLFGIMLTQNQTSVDIKTGSTNIIPASIAIGLFAALLITSLFNGNVWANYISEMPVPNTTIYDIGAKLISDYVYIFELLGMLLLVALIAATTMARKENVQS